MADLFSMGGYEVYVWSSYAIFVALLIWDYLAPNFKVKQAMRRARMIQRRQARKVQ
ncbi:heme exporter protein CcmD [Pseudomarimonas arenosa]|uniref:Heme exporter protein D n=1 Tax=Pseudomarimonas arenosa TaxID=2774145 RepID=A0AAW3ZJI5_9GAMM|nr:heme exporter protein CcmD [Pseudomarimonas arenosa]MBD8525327.1 heme exporter protein CcmD [Pseudomarimonas arenosa]